MPIRWLYDQAHGQNNDDLLHQPLIQSHSLYSMETEKQLDPANEYYSPEPSDDEVEHDKKKSSQKELVDREVKDVFEDDDDDDEEQQEEEEEDDDDGDRSEDNKNRQEDHYLLDEEMNDNEDSYSEEEPVLTVTLEELSSPSIAIADSDMGTPPASTSTTSTTTTTTTVVERDGNVETHVTTIIEEEVDTSHTIINENSSGNHDTDEDKTSSVVSISMADMQVTSIDGDSHHNGSTFNSSDSSSEMVNVVNEHDHEHKEEESFTSVVQETEETEETGETGETAEITTTTDTITQLEEESPVTTTLVTTESFVVDESTVNTTVRSGRKPLTITTTTSSLVVDESITNDTEDNDNSSSSATLPAMPRSPRIHPRSLASVMPPLPPSSLSGEDSFDLNDTSALSSSSPPPPPPIVVDSADQQIAISMSLPKSPHIQPHVLSTENWSDSEIVEEEEEIKEQTMVVVEEHEQEPSVIHEEHYMSTSSPPNVSSTTQEHLLPRSPRIRPITAHTSTLGDTKDESYHEDVDDDELSLDGNSMMLPPSPLMEPSMFQYPVDTTLVSAPYAMTTATTTTTTTTSNMLITEQPGTVSMSIQSNHVSSNEHHLSDAPSSPLPSIVTRSPALAPMDQSSYISSTSIYDASTHSTSAMQEEVNATAAAAAEIVSWSTEATSPYNMVTMSLPSYNTPNEQDTMVVTHEESSTHLDNAVHHHQETSFSESTTMTNTLDSYSIYNPWENAISPVTRPVLTISTTDDDGNNHDMVLNDEATSPLLLPQSTVDIDAGVSTTTTNNNNPNAINIPIIIDEASIIEDDIESDTDTKEDHHHDDDIPVLETEITSPVTANAQWQTSVSIATFEENLAHIKQSADEADENEPLQDAASFISGDASSMASFHASDHYDEDHYDDDDDDDEEVVITTDILERETAKALEEQEITNMDTAQSSELPNGSTSFEHSTTTHSQLDKQDDEEQDREIQEDTTEGDDSNKEQRKSTLAILVEEAANEGGVCASDSNQQEEEEEDKQEEEEEEEEEESTAAILTEPVLSNGATSLHEEDDDDNEDSIDTPFGHAMMASSTMQSSMEFTSTPQLPPVKSLDIVEPMESELDAPMQHESSHNSILLQATPLPLLDTAASTLPLLASDDWPPVSADDESVFSPILPEDPSLTGQHHLGGSSSSNGMNGNNKLDNEVNIIPTTSITLDNSLAIPSEDVSSNATSSKGKVRRRSSLRLIRRSRTFGDTNTTSSSKSKLKSHKKQTKQNTAGLSLNTTAASASASSLLIPSTQWGAADLHQGQATLTPSQVPTITTPIPTSPNATIDPTSAWSLSRSLDSTPHPPFNGMATSPTNAIAITTATSGISGKSTSHPMMISRSMGHQRHRSGGSHGSGSHSYGTYYPYPSRSHRFNSLDHKVDPDRFMSLTASAHGATNHIDALLGDEGWLSADGTRWIPPAETPSLNTPHNVLHHRGANSIDESYAALSSATPTANTGMAAATALGRHLLEGYNREIHAVLGGSLGTTINNTGMQRSLSEQWPAATPMTPSASSLSIEAKRLAKKSSEEERSGGGGDSSSNSKAGNVDPFADTYSPLTDTFSMTLSESYDSYRHPHMSLGMSPIGASSVVSPPPTSAAAGAVVEAAGTSATSPTVANQPPTPITTRKFMRKLSFVNQPAVSHVRIGGGVLSLDTPMVTPGDDSFPHGSYMDQRDIAREKNEHDEEVDEEEENDEIMDHSSTEGVFTFDKETLNMDNNTRISHGTEEMSMDNHDITSASPVNIPVLGPIPSPRAARWGAMTRSQLDRIEESGHSTLTTPQYEKRLGLAMSGNTSLPSSPSRAVTTSTSSPALPPNHLALPNNNYMDSKSSTQTTYSSGSGMGVPLLAQLPLSAVGEMNNYGNEFPFHATPNEWTQANRNLYNENNEDEEDDDEDAKSFSSPPCFAHQLASMHEFAMRGDLDSNEDEEGDDDYDKEMQQHRLLFPRSTNVDHMMDSSTDSALPSPSIDTITSNDSDMARPVSTHSVERSLFGPRDNNGGGLHEQGGSSIFYTSSTTGIDNADTTIPSSDLSSERLDPIRFSLLTRISDQLYSQEMRNNFGVPTVLAVGEWLAIGTSSGMVVLYDHAQNLRTILRHMGVVTAVAVSAHGLFVLAGFADGSIVVWDVRKNIIIRHIEPIPIESNSPPASPYLQQMKHTAQRLIKLTTTVATTNTNTTTSGTTSTTALSASTRNHQGHEWGSAILHVEFVGQQSYEIISADDQGLVFLHRLAKVPVIRPVDTIHILGRRRRNGPLSMTAQGMQPPRQAGTILCMSSLSTGVISHPADTYSFMAITTPIKMLIISTKPRIETHFKVMRSEKLVAATMEEEGFMATCGSTAWYSATLDEGEAADPLLAYSWDNRLAILRVIGDSVDNVDTSASKSSTSRSTAGILGMKRANLPRITFVYVNEWRGPCPIVAMQWVTRKMLVLYTSEDEILVFDRVANQVTERCDLRAIRLVSNNRLMPRRDHALYHNSNNEEEEAWPEVEMELAYYQSVRAHKGRVYLLGVDRLWMGLPLTWSDRIDACEQNGELLKALDIGVALIKGAPGLSTVGLPDDDLQRRVVVGARLMQLMRKATSMTFAIERVGQRHPRSCRDLARACIDASLCIGIESFLFDEIYEAFHEHHCRHWFLGGLAKAIRRGRIRLLPPVVAQDLIVYLRGRPRLLETVLLQLDLSTLDIDTVVSLCRRDGLWDALIWVWTRAVHDWISPTVELLKMARLLAGSSERRVKEILDKLLAYFDHVLQGRWFPSPIVSSQSASNRYWDEQRAIINDEQVCNEAKQSIYRFIFSLQAIRWPEHHEPNEMVSTDGILKQVIGHEDINDLRPYPYLSLLLDYDPKRWLDTLEASFKDEKFFDQSSTSISDAPDAPAVSDAPTAVTRQMIVDALIRCVSPYARDNFATVSATFVCIFLARQLHHHHKHIHLESATIEAILLRLTTDTTTTLHGATGDARQAAVQELLKVYVSPHTKQMIELYEQAGFYRVLETVYRNEHNYGKVVETYLRDIERRHQVFDCIRRLLSDKSRSVEKGRLLEKKRAHVRASVMELMPQLVRVDGSQCAKLVTDLFEEQHEEVVKQLEPDGTLVYAYLRGLFEARQRIRRALMRRRARQASDLASSSTTFDPSSSDQTTMNQLNSLPGLPQLLGRYIELLCERQPSQVRAFLADHEEDGIWLDSALTVCRYYEVTDAVVWILERRGELGAALEAILVKVQDCVIQVTKQLAREASEQFNDAAASVTSDWHPHWSSSERPHPHHQHHRFMVSITPRPPTTDVYRAVDAIVLHLRMAVELCERVSTRVLTTTADTPEHRTLERQSEDLWFMLLVQFVDAYRTLMAAATEQHRPSQSQSSFARRYRHDDTSSVSSAASSPSPSIIPPAQEPLDPSSQMIRGGLHESLTELLQATASSGVSLPKLLLRLVQSEDDDPNIMTTNSNSNEGDDDDVEEDEDHMSTKSHQESTPRLFADLRDVFFGMLDLYKFEAQLRRVAHRLIESDVFSEMRLSVHTRSQGWRVTNGGDCDRCHRRLWLDARNPQARIPVNAMQVFDAPLRWPHHATTTTTSTTSSNGKEPANGKRAMSTFSSLPTLGKRAMSYDRRMSSSHSIMGSNTMMLMTSSSLSTTAKELSVVSYCCGHAFHQTCLLPSPPSNTNNTNNTNSSNNGGGALHISRQNSLVSSLSMQGRLLSPPLSPSTSYQPPLPGNVARSPYPSSDQQSEEAQEIQLFSASSRPSESLNVPCPVCHPPRLLNHQII